MRHLIPTLLLLLSLPAAAGQLAGVTLPDSATVGGQSLVLNGIGLREKLWIDVYVGALYLPARTTDSGRAIEEDVPKRIVMHFIYRQVTKDQLCETYEEGREKLADPEAMKPRFDRLCGMLETVKSGEEISLDYVPGTGTTVTVKGANKGTIEGADFMRAIWAVYIGPDPPTAKFKAGMMGG